MVHGGNVIAELPVDHREVDELFIRIEAQPARDTRRHERTRPHPPAPTTPPGNKILDPGVGLVDRDLLTGRKFSRGGREGRAAVTQSTGALSRC
jgi:hypothetical protein